MLSQTVEYALRAVVYLATQPGKPATTEEVAGRTRVPAAYLAKILQGLSRSGLVRSQRGVGGGVTLDRDPALLTIFDVVNAVEPIQRIRGCPLGLTMTREGLCPLHDRIDAAIAAVESAFRRTTLAEILDESGQPFCPSPCPVPAAAAGVVPLA